MTTDAAYRTRALWLIGVLHAFTHIYHVALMPLYMLMQRDFGLSNLGGATLLVTVMMASYFIPSYPIGMLADRFSRKKLLTVGLLTNALGFVALALSPTYPWAIISMILAGFGGSFYHPAATAMVARLYPTNTGRALGLSAMGASAGFFFGPVYSGWRAQSAGWRAPVLELGLLGIAGAMAFWFLAHDDKPVGQQTHQRARTPLFPSGTLWAFFIAASFCFSLRDFTGSSMGTVGSLFLQRAHRLSLTSTGFALSGIFVMSLISNPLFGMLSDRGRLKWTFVVLIIAAAAVATYPHLPKAALVPGFMIYGFFFMASYPVVEAALMESVPDAVRGRIFGFFITISGLVGNISHWLVGEWVQRLGPSGTVPQGYYRLYAVLASLILLSIFGVPCLYAIRRREPLAAHERGEPESAGALAMQNPEL